MPSGSLGLRPRSDDRQQRHHHAGHAERHPGVAAATGIVSWAPASGAADLAGNASATTAYVETDNDSDF